MLKDEYSRIKKKLAESIRKARKEAGLTQAQLAKKMSITQPLISRIEKGESMPERKTLEKIALALGKDKDYFEKIYNSGQSKSAVGSEELSGYRGEVADLINKIINIVAQKHVAGEIVPLSALESEEKDIVKEVEMPVGAGECFTTDGIVAEHTLPRSLTYGATHMLRVRGQSMEPYVMDGDILLVVPQSNLEHDGQMAVVNVSNQVNSVKFVYSKGDLVGIGRSKEEARWYPKDEVRIQGVVVGKISTLNVIKEFEDRAKFKPKE